MNTSTPRAPAAQAPRRTARSRPARALAALVAAAAALPALAQPAEPAVLAFERWLRVLEVVPVSAPPAPAVVAVSPPARPAPAAAPYEPWPVILGEPELPLVGAARTGGSSGAAAWPASLNYQGVHVAYLMLDRSGDGVEQRPLSVAPRAGERFKLRVTPTFDAQVRVGTVTGQGWTLQRGGAFYPAQGGPVRVAAARTVDLPVERDHYFVVGDTGAPRLLLQVQHERADESNRSRQPAYRRDQLSGTSYLQLVPAGARPAIEQLITAAP